MNTVIFDMDGVILDSEYTYILAQQALLAEEGFQVPKEVFNEFIGMADPEVWQILVERYSLPHSPSHYLAQQGARHQAILAAEGLWPMPGIRDLLAGLAADGYQIGLASSSPHTLISQYLDALALKDYFTVRVSGQDVPQAKPAPDIYLLALESLKVQAHETIVIEDAAKGIQAAKGAGIPVIGLANDYQQDLSQADYVVDSLLEAGQCIRQHFSSRT